MCERGGGCMGTIFYCFHTVFLRYPTPVDNHSTNYVHRFMLCSPHAHTVSGSGKPVGPIPQPGCCEDCGPRQPSNSGPGRAPGP